MLCLKKKARSTFCQSLYSYPAVVISPEKRLVSMYPYVRLSVTARSNAIAPQFSPSNSHFLCNPRGIIRGRASAPATCEAVR